MNSGYPSYNGQFLYKGLSVANETGDELRLCDYAQEEELAHIRSPFVEDNE
jgi:hypothetical protein